MSWESTVRQLIGSGRPRSAYALSQSWTELSRELQSLADHITRLKDMTTNDALTPGWQPAMPPPPKGKGWTGPAADAFREHVAKIAKDVSILVEPSNSLGASLGRISDALCTGISQVPVPIFQDRNLPGGVDVQDIINGNALGKDSGTEFAKRLRQDIDKGGKYYADGGFKQRIDEANQHRFFRSGDSVALNGRHWGGVPQWQREADEYQRNRDNWYSRNQAVASAAMQAVRVAYREEFSNVAPTLADASLGAGHGFGETPAVAGSPAGDAAGAGDGMGSGLAGAGGSFSAGDAATAGACASPGLGGTGGAAAIGIGGGAGSATVGARAMGAMGAGMMPGLFSPGSASAGTGRSPMPALTSANKGVGMPGADMMGPDWAEATNWSRDEEDVWGTESPDLPRDLLGS